VQEKVTLVVLKQHLLSHIKTTPSIGASAYVQENGYFTEQSRDYRRRIDW
jgi:hypothetical protein